MLNPTFGRRTELPGTVVRGGYRPPATVLLGSSDLDRRVSRRDPLTKSAHRDSPASGTL